MRTAKLFTKGRSQAVRLPRDCRMPGERVYVQKLGDAVLLTPTDDFIADRAQPEIQVREVI